VVCLLAEDNKDSDLWQNATQTNIVLAYE